MHDTPGVTRDRQAVDAVFDGLDLRLIDTAGFEDAASGSVAHRMTEQTLAAIAEADALLFVIDARAGVTAGDEIIAQALRKSGKPVILAANKCEGRIEPPAEACGPGLWRADRHFRRARSGHGGTGGGAGAAGAQGRPAAGRRRRRRFRR